MNKTISKKTFLFLIALQIQLLSVIIEVDRFQDILQYVTPQSLVLLDIDNTTLEPALDNQIASEQWFSSLLKKNPCAEKAITEYCCAALQAPMHAVEPNIPEVIAQVQTCATVLGFTARSLVLAPCTIHYLQLHNLFLSAHFNDCGFMIENSFPVLLYHDIIFCQGHKNSVTLFTVLDALGIYPESIVMIDDKIRYLHEMELGCHQRGIQFFGLRYGFLDQKVEKFLSHHE